ncbi:MAG: APC family permease [Francisellaceae bacterium]
MIHKEKIGLLSATFMGISAIIGSGWLFSPYVAAHISGPAAILAWIIGAIIVLVLGLCFSEIAALYPLRGLSAVITSISHNKYFGFPFAIANWLGIIAVVALEADATIQYLINLFPTIDHLFYSNHQMTPLGNGCAAILVLFYSIINFWGVKLLAKTNNIITLLKLFIPLLTIIVVAFTAFHPQNFTADRGNVMPYGFSSVIATILAAGIIVSFNGFQSIVSFASEIKKPHRTIPMALCLSISTCLVIYLLLQIVFIAALPPELLQSGWHQLAMSAPMVQLTGLIGLNFFAIILYTGATVAPLGTAITFTGSASRMFTAMARQKQMPKYFDHVHEKYGVSRRSLIFNTILALIFLFLFKSWSDLAEVLGLFHVLSYITVPLAMTVFRQETRRSDYKFYLPGGGIIALLLFFVFNYLISFGSVRIVSELVIMIIVFQVIFVFSNIKHESAEKLIQYLKSTLTLMSYMILLPLMSYLQHFTSIGISLVIIIGFSMLYFYLLTNKRFR